MGYLLLCILANVGIFTCFRAFAHYRLNTFRAIVINYMVCVLTGVVFAGTGTLSTGLRDSGDWLPYAVALGAVFIGTFYLMARTTQVFSMTVSSIASKMSLVIPVLFSLLILQIESKDYSAWNYMGMFIALAAIFAASYKPGAVRHSGGGQVDYLLPLAVFLLGGLIDSTINFVSYRYLDAEEEAIFPIVIFISAGLIGLAVLLFRRDLPDIRDMIGGLILGIVNYFSVYYLIKSLGSFGHDGALVYPLVNVGIIIFAALVSVLFFRERFSRINLAGIILAILAIFLLSHQEILQGTAP